MGAQRVVQDNHILTSREEEVLTMVAAGLRAKDIAEAVGLSFRTVEDHIADIKYRLRAKTTPHAVSIAIGMGIIKPEQMPVDLSGEADAKTAAI